MSQGSPFDRRRAGLLLHPTSLPGGFDNGDLGPEAYRFVDFMAACGFTVWQTLPLGPPHDDLSPYSAQSAHAGNPRLIALEPLVEAGWLQPDGGPSEGEDGWTYRQRRLSEARQGFQQADRARGEDEAAHVLLLLHVHAGHGFVQQQQFCLLYTSRCV